MLWYQSIPAWFQKFFPRFIWHIPSPEKTVYLTFDDGPHPEITPWVLEELEKNEVKATFFCVGDNVRKFPETFRMLKLKGHRIGNHTMHHLKGWNTDTESYIENVEACDAFVDSDLFRPPYGRIKRSQAKLLLPRFKIVMWSLLALDFEKNLDNKKALEGLMKKTRTGDIIVFHDSAKAEKNLRFLLPQYLQFLKEKGFNCAIL
jgi:peptidoglycan/xylan/chitin deacetylase (PgdA/CDA1 family)